MSAITGKVTKLEQVNDHVYTIELSFEQAFDYEAGQYLQVVMGEKDKRPFSIASAPYQTNLELHIGATEKSRYSMDVIDLLQKQGMAEFEVGLGQAQLRQPSERPIILLAGGTGFSYVQSIARQLAHTKPEHQVIIYWGGKTHQSLYANDAMKKWQQNHPNFTYVPVIEHPEPQWQGKTGYVHLAVMQDIQNLEDYDIYMAGHFDMIKVVRDDFVAKGAQLEHMFSDAFAYI